MTSFALVTALVDSHSKRDYDRFRAITLQIAAGIASKSPKGAEQLRNLVNNTAAISLVPLPSADGLLSTPHTLAELDDMVLATPIRDHLVAVVMEHERSRILLEHGLTPARKLLFTGPPGVGKTMAASAIANAVGLPLFRVELHEVVCSYLGETSKKLHKVFEHVRQMPAVYLFDEFDALATSRDDIDGSGAGSEMRRVVNSLLQFIEDDRSESMIVATTNYAKVIDKAMFRRFDHVITFEVLDPEQIYKLCAKQLDMSSVSIGYNSIARDFPDLGHADLCAALTRVRKDYVLHKSPITHEGLCAAIRARLEYRCAS
jgi:SpoVK/Ycf46/Vps4 family AAA+-type ATPase